MFIAPSYADVENRAIFGAVTALTDALLADGHRVVIDATNLLARNREPAVAVARRRGVPVTFIRVSGTDAETRARLASRRTARAANDHSEADESIYERMRDQRFEPPAEGFVDLANGEDLPAEIDRVVAAIEAEP
jgi:predicted kinase